MNNSSLGIATVDRYHVIIGDDTGDDQIRLKFNVNCAVSSTVISSSATIESNRQDFGLAIRFTVSATGVWTLCASPIPTSNAARAVASLVPNEYSAEVNQDSGTIHSMVPTAS